MFTSYQCTEVCPYKGEHSFDVAQKPRCFIEYNSEVPDQWLASFQTDVHLEEMLNEEQTTVTIEITILLG